MNAEIKRLKTLAQDVDGKYRKLSIETKENEQQIIDYYEHVGWEFLPLFICKILVDVNFFFFQ